MIISSAEDYNKLLDRMNREKYIFVPIFTDRWYHRCDNILLCTAIVFSDNTISIVSNTHPDAPCFVLPMNDNAITIDDVNIFYYLRNERFTLFETITPYTHDTYIKFEAIRNINKILPLTVWAINVQAELTNFRKVFDNIQVLASDQFVQMRDMIMVLRNIENEGIAIDSSVLSKYFTESTLKFFKQNIVYSEYNPFTITGRPSNRFAGINFSALNKSDGVRHSFISRYDTGQLVQFDFEAYHLRLLADDLGVILPHESIHEYLAKIYYNCEEISSELYARGKQKTFEIIYGLSNETHGIQLFEKIHQKRNFYKDKSSVVLPNGRVVSVNDANSHKLFNYYMQSLETIKTIPKLKKVLALLKNSNNHLILYTYDSILLDMECVDTTLLSQISDILTEDNRFPVRMSVGKTYGDF